MSYHIMNFDNVGTIYDNIIVRPYGNIFYNIGSIFAIVTILCNINVVRHDNIMSNIVGILVTMLSK